MGVAPPRIMEAAPEVVVKSERSPSSKRVRRTARKSTNGWKPEQCIYARDHNGDLFFNRSATLEQEPPLLKWTRQHYDVARVVISRMSWTSRRKLASSSIELRRTVDKARKDGKCTTRLLLQVRKVEHPPQKVVTPQLLGAGFGDTMQVTALDPESKVPIARTTPDGPAALQRYGCATMDGRLYVAGGHDFNWYVASLQVLDLGTGTWKSAPPMSIARDGHSCTPLGGKIYVIGGRAGRHRMLDSVEVYDPDTATWRSAASAPTARRGHRCTSAAGKLYLSGGKDATGRTLAADSDEAYDPNTDTWTHEAFSAPIEQNTATIAEYKERSLGA